MGIRNNMLTLQPHPDEIAAAKIYVTQQTPQESAITKERKARIFNDCEIELLQTGREPLISITGVVTRDLGEPDDVYFNPDGYRSNIRTLYASNTVIGKPFELPLQYIYDSINHDIHSSVQVSRQTDLIDTSGKKPLTILELVSLIICDLRTAPVYASQIFLKTVNVVEVRFDALTFCLNDFDQISLCGLLPIITMHLYNSVQKQIQPKEEPEPELIALEFGR